MMRTICVINVKGGVAKTTTAINLAAGLSRKEKNVLLIDLDPQGNVDLSLKLKAEYDISDAISGKIPIQDCVVNLGKNFDIITARDSLVSAENYLRSQNDLVLKDLLKTINGYDFIIIDCPPSQGMINENVLAFCKEAFIPTSTDFLGFEALKRMLDIIKNVNENYSNDLRVSKIIPTLYDRRNKICKETLAELQNIYPELLSYPIRMNSKVKEAPKFGKSIFSYSKSSPGAQDYGKLVEDVLAMNVVEVVQASDLPTEIATE